MHILIFISLAVMLTSCGPLARPPAPTERPVQVRDLVGIYHYESRIGKVIELILKEDGTFEQTVPTTPNPTHLAGIWKLKGSDISFDNFWTSSFSDPEKRDEDSTAHWWVVDSYFVEGGYAIFGGDNRDPDYWVVRDEQSRYKK